MTPVTEYGPVTPEQFHAEIRSANRPAVMRGQCADWPVVRAPDPVAYLKRFATPQPFPVVHAPASEGGRFHYDAALTGFNFRRGTAPFPAILDALTAEAQRAEPDALALQSAPIPDLLPGFASLHPMPLLPGSVVPRLWIGNAIQVATHNDAKENIAVCAVGARRFTLFSPEHLPNLYIGPLEHTPAGPPVSMVHLDRPDLARYPRFAEALAGALTALLAPGDALYIPYHWYHHVASLEPVSALVNYWWNDARADVGNPMDALLHAMLTLRTLPHEQRASWRAVFDHYVFQTGDHPAAHLPAHAQGALADPDAQAVAAMKAALKRAVAAL